MNVRVWLEAFARIRPAPVRPSADEQVGPRGLLTLALLKGILADVKFGHWVFSADVAMGDGFFLQVRFVTPGQRGTMDGATLQRGRKWYVSRFSTDGEVLQTALKAVLTALEHEARESFTYKGHAIFGPHFSIAALVRLAEDSANQQERVQ